MAKKELNGNYKKKFLNLLSLLRNESSEDNPISTQEIQCKLAKLGIAIDRRTLSTEMQELEDFGWNIVCVKKGHQNAYYMKRDYFNEYEIDMLINSVKSAGFLTKEETDNLVDRLIMHSNKNNKRPSDDNCIFYNVEKYFDFGLFKKIELVKDTIMSKHQLSFNYFDYNEKCEKVYRNNKTKSNEDDKKIYIVNPITIIFNEGHYYLLSYNFKYKKINTYRISRMDNIKKIDKLIDNKDALEFLNNYLPLTKGKRNESNFNELVENFSKQAFKMYAGRFNRVGLLFSKSLMNVIFDRFGKNITIIPRDNDMFETVINVQTSDVFWGWIAQFGGQIVVKSPNSCVKDYKEFCENLI